MAPLPLQPLVVDPLTVADDDDFLDRLALEPNLPARLAEEIAGLYQ